MPETPSTLTKKYKADIPELARNNLFVHGTKQPHLFERDENDGGILATGLRNGVKVSEQTLARNMMFSTAVRYVGNGINGVLLFYDPPKGTLDSDDQNFPPREVRINRGNLGSEHMAFWLETSKSGIANFVRQALTQMLQETATNQDVIGGYVDDLALLIAEHAQVPDLEAGIDFTVENIAKNHRKLDIDTATCRACEILWNAFSETLLFMLSEFKYITFELAKMMEDDEKSIHLFLLLTGQKKDTSIIDKPKFVSDFTRLWKLFKTINLPYDILQDEVQTRIDPFRNQAEVVEIWLNEMLKRVDAFHLEEKKIAEQESSQSDSVITSVIRRVFWPFSRFNRS